LLDNSRKSTTGKKRPGIVTAQRKEKGIYESKFHSSPVILLTPPLALAEIDKDFSL
jgi:hypothetical protein